jgi:hypothetical protein
MDQLQAAFFDFSRFRRSLQFGVASRPEFLLFSVQMPVRWVSVFRIQQRTICRKLVK